jgi:hypothetical protein
VVRVVKTREVESTIELEHGKMVFQKVNTSNLLHNRVKNLKDRFSHIPERQKLQGKFAILF